MSEESRTEAELAVVARGEVDRYGSYYYEHCCGQPYDRSPAWLALFARFADRIAAEIRPESVLDAGCAMGLLVDALVARGIDAYGVDISEYAIERVHESVRDRCRVGSILEPFGRRYTLIVTIEVLEHLRPDDAETAVANLCAHADDILFSSTPFDYNEATHYNVQPPEYWAVLFARHGFTRDLDYDASFITRWATRFRKTEMTPWRLVLGYERKVWRLMQENLGARESLVDHQDRLMRSEGELARVRAELASVEPNTRSLEAQLSSSRDAETLLKAEIQRVFTEGQRVVQQYQAHVETLDIHIQNLNREIISNNQRLTTLERTLAEERTLRESRETRMVADRQEVVSELEAIKASRAWKVCAALARARSRLLNWGRGPSTPTEDHQPPAPHRGLRPMGTPRPEIRA